MRFQVPQFLETETKVVGPLTIKQFAYVGSGVTLVLILNRLISSFGIFLAVSFVIMVFALALAFYKVDGIPFPNYLVRMFSFSLGIKKYTYTKQQNTTQGIDEFKDFTNISLRK